MGSIFVLKNKADYRENTTVAIDVYTLEKVI